jgi:hypothetical protein
MLRLPAGRRSFELTRLSLYRVGLAGTYSKYRVVPRSAIVGYEELREAVRLHQGPGNLAAVIAVLWQRHGAPSREVIDQFLLAATELDRCSQDTAAAVFSAILRRPCALAGLDRDGVRGLDDARNRLLEGWVRVCRPRSVIGRIRDYAELALCFLLRRGRQYIVAVVVNGVNRRGG